MVVCELAISEHMSVDAEGVMEEQLLSQGNHRAVD